MMVAPLSDSHGAVSPREKVAHEADRFKKIDLISLILSIAVVVLINSALASFWYYHQDVLATLRKSSEDIPKTWREVNMAPTRTKTVPQSRLSYGNTSSTRDSVSHAQSRTVDLILFNQCPWSVWPGIQADGPLSELPENGGFEMSPYETRKLEVPAQWKNGKIWARVSCDEQMQCESGSCGNVVECAGKGGEAPITVADFNLGTETNFDEYRVSLLKGYNIIITIDPQPGSFFGFKSGNNCGKAGNCKGDLNPKCPPDFRKKNDDEWTYACKAECPKDKPSCDAAKHTQMFKKHCPTAYSFNNDTLNSTFTCAGNAGRSPIYKVTFCG